MINRFTASCYNIREGYGFGNKHGHMKKVYNTMAFIEVTCLVLGLLGVLKVGPFANMSHACCYALIGVSGGFLGIDIFLAVRKKKELNGIIESNVQLEKDLADKGVKLEFRWLSLRYFIGDFPVATLSEVPSLTKRLTGAEPNSGFYHFRTVDSGISQVNIRSKCDANKMRDPNSRRSTVGGGSDEVATEALCVTNCEKLKGFTYLLP